MSDPWAALDEPEEEPGLLTQAAQFLGLAEEEPPPPPPTPYAERDPFAEGEAIAAAAPLEPAERKEEAMRRVDPWAVLDQPRRGMDIPRAPPSEPPGTMGHLWGEFAQGSGGTFAGVVKGASLNLFGPDQKILSWMDGFDKAVESGSNVDMAVIATAGAKQWSVLSDPFDAFLVARYTIASPEERAVLRANAEQDISEAEDNFIYKGAERFDQWVKASAPVDPELAKTFWLGDVPNAFGSLGAFALAAGLSQKAAARYGGQVISGKVAGYLAPALLGAGVNRAAIFTDAIESGATISEALDAADIAAVVGLSEAAPIGRLLNRADKISGGAVRKALIRFTKQGTEEAIQEAGIEILNNIIAFTSYDPERGFWTEEVTGAGAVGFTTGALLEALMSLTPGRRRATAARGRLKEIVPTEIMERLEAGEITVQEALVEAFAVTGDAAAADAAAAGGDALDQVNAATEQELLVVDELPPDGPGPPVVPPEVLPVAPEAVVEPPLLTEGVPPPPPMEPLPVPEEEQPGTRAAAIRAQLEARGAEEAAELERAARPEEDVGAAFEAREQEEARRREIEEEAAREQRAEEEIEVAARARAEEPRPTLAAVAPPEVAELAEPPVEAPAAPETPQERLAAAIEQLGEPVDQYEIRADVVTSPLEADQIEEALRENVGDAAAEGFRGRFDERQAIELELYQQRQAERAAAAEPEPEAPALPALPPPTAITVTPEGEAVLPGEAVPPRAPVPETREELIDRGLDLSQVPPDVPMVSAEEVADLRRQYGPPNSINVGAGLFGDRGGQLFVNDDTGEAVAFYLPTAAVVPSEGAPAVEEPARGREEVRETAAPEARRLRELRSVRRGPELPSAQYVQGEQEDLEGLPKTFNIRGRGEVEFGFDATAREAAASYTEKAGIEYKPRRTYTKLNRLRARRIANAFEQMEHAPNDPEVRAAYGAMIEETIAQYETILQTGLQIEYILEGENPYEGNPRLALLDIIENNHFWVYSTRDGYGTDEAFDPSDHPLLADTQFEISGQVALANDLFRVVHDFFGHLKDGVGFRAEGEENAWLSHSAMYSPLARRAMTSETRGQNSWVNFGPFGEQNQTASGEDTVYSDQKAGLMPEWVSEVVEEPPPPTAPAEVVELRPEVPTAEEIRIEAETAATSPTSAQAPPTPRQLIAGNYFKPTIRLRPGVNVKVENPAGSTREGVDRFGRPFSQVIEDHYGYIEGTEAADGDPLDAFIGEDPESERVFVVDQINQETGEFDEHKVMLGYDNPIRAKRAYKRNYEPGWDIGPMTEMSMDQFQRWLETGDLTRPASEQPTGQDVLAPGEFEELVDRQRARRGRRTPIRYRLDDEPEVTTPPFYSRMRETFEEFLPAQVKMQQLPRMIQGWLKNNRFREDEAAWFDLEEAFADRTTVPKEEILDYLDFMQPEIVERTLAQREPTIYETRADMVDALEAEFGTVTDILGNDLTAVTGTIYNKDALTVGYYNKRGAHGYRVVFAAMDKETEPRHETWQAIPGGTNFREILITLPRKPGRFLSLFKSSHYPDHENVVASALVVDMTLEDGSKVMHILELQSDWHQLGRAARTEEIDRLMRAEKITKKEASARVPKDWGYVSPDERIARERAEAVLQHGIPIADDAWVEEVLGSPERGAVEEAPFSSTWPVIMMRRVVNRAVRGGYSWVTFSRGESVAALYKQRDEVDQIYYDDDRKYLSVTSPEGRTIVSGVMELDEVQGVIGKELTDRIRDQIQESDDTRAQYSVAEEPDPDSGEYLVYDPNGEIVRNWIGDPLTVIDPADFAEVFLFNSSVPGATREVTLSGTAIQIGGENLLTFYNKELPEKTSKLMSKLDKNAKVRNVTLKEFGTQVHGFPITDQVRGRIQERGQVLWRRAEETAAVDQRLQEIQTAEELNRTVADILRPLTNALPLLKPVILARPQDAPAHTYQRMVEDGALGAKGLYDTDTDTIYIFAGNHTSAADIVRTALHEGVAHKGLRALLSEGPLNELLDDIYANAAIPDAFKERFPDDEEGHREAAEEWVAELAETNPQSTFVQRVVAMIRGAFRGLGLVRDWKADDIHSLLRDTRSALAGFQDVTTITITQEAEVAETGEIVEIEQQADVALRQVQKRVGVVESLRECLAT